MRQYVFVVDVMPAMPSVVRVLTSTHRKKFKLHFADVPFVMVGMWLRKNASIAVQVKEVNYLTGEVVCANASKIHAGDRLAIGPTGGG